MELLIGAGFILVTIVFYGILLLQLRSKLLLFGLIAWITFLAAWSYSGIATRFDLFPFNMAPVLIAPLIAIITITIKGDNLLSKISLKTLTNLQVFRVFVEILLWGLFIEDLLPVQMTFEGLNWDIISGLTAPLAAIFLVRSKWGLAAWNIMCLALLINIVTVAILSMPGPLRVFANEPSNVIVARFPFILLPGLLVPLAYALSFFSLRKIFSLNL